MKEIAVEGSIGYSYDLSPYVLNGLSIDLGLKAGYDNSEAPLGDSTHRRAFNSNGVWALEKRDYFYFGASADLTYKVTENAKAKIGVACAGNSVRDVQWVNSELDNKFAWFSAAIDCSF
jgi:hypothetical protein